MKTSRFVCNLCEPKCILVIPEETVNPDRCPFAEKDPVWEFLEEPGKDDCVACANTVEGGAIFDCKVCAKKERTIAKCVCPLCNQSHDPKLISGEGAATSLDDGKKK